MNALLFINFFKKNKGSSMKSFGHAFQVHVGPMRSASRGSLDSLILSFSL